MELRMNYTILCSYYLEPDEDFRYIQRDGMISKTIYVFNQKDVIHIHTVGQSVIAVKS